VQGGILFIVYFLLRDVNVNVNLWLIVVRKEWDLTNSRDLG
jgi:hypothetical protein